MGSLEKSVAATKVFSNRKLVAACIALWTLLAPLAGAAGTLREADTSRQARDEALRALPLQRLQPLARRKITEVTQNATIYRRLPLEMIQCDPEMFVFLVRYPEVVVNMWRMMGVTKIQLNRVADYVVRADDGSGTQTDVELMYGTPGLHLIYAEGEYSGPLFRRRMRGRCVLLLRTGYQPDAQGRMKLTNQLDIFLNVDNFGADLAARTMQGMIGRTADQNFRESARFIEQVSLQSESNGDGMQRLAGKLQQVEPLVRNRFVSIVSKISEEAEQRLAATIERRGPPTARLATPGSMSPMIPE